MSRRQDQDERPLGLPLVYALTLVLASCSIVYELLLAQTLSALLGNTVLRHSITIGCYLGALGLGAMVCGEREQRPAARLLLVELALSVVVGLAVLLFFVADLGLAYLLPTDASVVVDWSFLALTHVVIFAVGFLSGFEIPLLMAMAERVKPKVGNRVLAVDYFGSLIGSIAFPLVLLPHAGLVATGFLIAGLNVTVFVALALHRGGRAGLSLAGVGLGLVLASGLGLARAAAMEREHDHAPTSLGMGGLEQRLTEDLGLAGLTDQRVIAADAVGVGIVPGLDDGAGRQV